MATRRGPPVRKMMLNMTDVVFLIVPLMLIGFYLLYKYVEITMAIRWEEEDMRILENEIAEMEIEDVLHSVGTYIEKMNFK